MHNITLRNYVKYSTMVRSSYVIALVTKRFVPYHYTVQYASSLNIKGFFILASSMYPPISLPVAHLNLFFKDFISDLKTIGHSIFRSF